jgi:hypothetical protein
LLFLSEGDINLTVVSRKNLAKNDAEDTPLFCIINTRLAKMITQKE